MEDNDFDQRYADKMRRTGAPDFSDEDWERLFPRLDAQQRRRWRVLPLWWLGVLSGLLLCASIGGWWMWRQAELRTDALHTEWQQVRRERVTLHDTIWSKVVVYQYDTVYRTVIYHSAPGHVSQVDPALPGQADPEPVRTGKTSVSENKLDLEMLTGQSPAHLDRQSSGNDTSGKNPDHAKSRLAFQRLPPRIAALEIPVTHLPRPENDLVLIPSPRSPRPLLLIPRKFRIGVGGGMLLPIADNLSQRTGFSTSLGGEAVFSEPLALTLEGVYAGLRFKGKEYDESLGLPSFTPPGDDYSLQYFEVHEGFKPILQLSAGMRYWLRATQQFSPYLGLGYAAQWHPAYELEVEYTNPMTGMENSISVDVPALGKPISLGSLHAGLRYRFSAHWFLQTGADYQFKINAQQPGIPRFLGFRSMLLYGF